jgi:hypothetical protein
VSFLKRLVFKLLELTLGLRPYFTLQTRNPIFVNFRLSAGEAEAVRRALPAGFTLCPIRFTEGDDEAAFWISYNLYELRYPRPEMARVRKVRCEINTFVRDAEGRAGVLVFCGSPLVSRGDGTSAIEKVADLAERLVLSLYGCGRLVPLRFELTETALHVALEETEAALAVDLALLPHPAGRPPRRLSDEYYRFNDVSFFRGGQTHDLVFAGSEFLLARWEEIDPGSLASVAARSPFFQRPPDRIYLHRGTISYLVSALHRTASPRSHAA